MLKNDGTQKAELQQREPVFAFLRQVGQHRKVLGQVRKERQGFFVESVTQVLTIVNGIVGCCRGTETGHISLFEPRPASANLPPTTRMHS